MIKKKDCYDFLEIEKNKAVDNVKDRFDKQIEEQKCGLLSTYKPQIDKVQKLVNELQDEALGLEGKLRQDKNVGFDRYVTISHEISSYTGGNEVYRQIKLDSSFHMGDIQKFRDKRDKEVQAIKNEYSKVAMIVKNKANGQQAAEYLKGIGFNITSLEKAENNQLMTISINKNLLFVKEGK